MQRFKAVELASAEGTWKVAQHLELILPMGVAATSREELEDPAREAEFWDRTLEQNDLHLNRSGKIIKNNTSPQFQRKICDGPARCNPMPPGNAAGRHDSVAKHR